MGKFTFRKQERLKKEKDIKELFDKGSSFYLFPFKVLTLPSTENSHPFHQVLISVSKRHFKNAVERNRIKRQIREGYRLNKHLLPAGPALYIGFLYSHKEMLATAEIMSKMVHALRKISKVSIDPAKSS